MIQKPMEIEAKSFEIISAELKSRYPHLDVPKEQLLVLKRVIHSTADFDYAEILRFSDGAVKKALSALAAGCHVVTDTQMAFAGINKTALAALGGAAHCFMSDPDVAKEAVSRGITRAAVSMERAAALPFPCIFAVGNAPTALSALAGLIGEGRCSPVLVVGVPVGFVNIIEAKEQLMKAPVPYIVSEGRKGGSNVAAAIINALLYQLYSSR